MMRKAQSIGAHAATLPTSEPPVVAQDGYYNPINTSTGGSHTTKDQHGNVIWTPNNLR